MAIVYEVFCLLVMVHITKNLKTISVCGCGLDLNCILKEDLGRDSFISKISHDF